MKDVKDILKQLPSSWEEVTLGDFQKLTSILISEAGDGLDGIENTISVISRLTDISVEELEELPLKELQVLGTKLSFMADLPTKGKATVTKWKKPDEISYNSYVKFIQMKPEQQMENLHVFVQHFSKTQLTAEQILKLPITDAMTGLFFFSKQLLKYLKASLKSARLTTPKDKAKAVLQHLKRKIRSSKQASIK